ncbi:hypothetical protein PFISCL1PPCAC_4649, partial [Pristionchus fissidentatus]
NLLRMKNRLLILLIFAVGTVEARDGYGLDVMASLVALLIGSCAIIFWCCSCCCNEGKARREDIEAAETAIDAAIAIDAGVEIGCCLCQCMEAVRA